MPQTIETGGPAFEPAAVADSGGTRVGQLSRRTMPLPEADRPPMPAIAAPGVIYNGQPVAGFERLGAARGYPDVRSFRRKFGLVIPATNTTMEHELWDIVFRNQHPGGLQGVGLHTSNVITPSPALDSADALAAYSAQFLGGLKAAIDTALLAQPHYMIMGMSLEHVLEGLDAIRSSMRHIEEYVPLPWATWHDAAAAALRRYSARRIGLLTPFDAHGNRRAARMFEDLGFEVVASVGFACANALHIAHVPDWAKERAIMDLLATEKNALDAIVQCGTNMSLVQLAERLEPVVRIPILGINAVTFWYALREAGIGGAVYGAGRLLREF
jgi:maleate isomerase